VTLRATADRYVPKTTNPIPDPSVGGGANVPITLECTKVRGRVIDDNLPPNPQIYVSVVLDFPDGTSNVTTTNNPDGTFIFDCVRHGPANIWTPILSSHPMDVLHEVSVVQLKLQWDGVEVDGMVTDSVPGLPTGRDPLGY